MASLMDEVVGQKSAKDFLKATLTRARVPQALALVGPPGVGKFFLAKAFAQAILCEHSQQGGACGSCVFCLRVRAGTHEGLLVLPRGEGKVERFREMTSFFHLSAGDRPRILILEDAEEMTAQASNSLLKTLEEPGPRHFFILTVSRPSKLLPTVASRVQRVKCFPLSSEEVGQLVKAPEWALRAAQGSPSMAKDLSASEDLRRRSFEVFRLLIWEKNFSEAEKRMSELVQDKSSLPKMQRFLLQFLRDCCQRDQPFHSDLMAETPETPAPPLGPWLRALVDLGSDLEGPVDKGLAVSHFLHQIRWASFS